MSGPRLTLRVRLTLLYTGLSAACGAIVIVISYALVARIQNSDQSVIRMTNAADFVAVCQGVAADALTQDKCRKAIRDSVVLGAQSQREATLGHLVQYSLLTLAAVILLAALVAWIMAGRVLRPVHAITEAARTASERNLSARVALGGPRDELRELADTFDAMLTRLEAAFDSHRRFIANAGHELRTPLTVMRTTLDVVLAKPSATVDELRRMAHDVRGAVIHAERLINALLTLARNDRGLVVHEPVDVATVAEDVLDATQPRDRRLHAQLGPAMVAGDVMLMERLITNLVDNAVRYNVPDGDVWLSTSTVDGQVRIMVANTGPVVPPDAIGTLFEPFQRLHDRTGTDGFGLGLPIVASIAAVHGGAVLAEPRTTGGLTITVVIDP
ncbi:sensor histidine kinase [Phytohabitans houttuyneae]|uniref:histidine kinase n=1 Tax=Phytohabitans houttuyneae TaxID=1076126 RepID=A0A6V8KJP9_9ACTN|nr:HAMP domain-containing sensor histidine kinase [Phytohabitans houttuyneae]GFJ81957.1 two-component sensor histidine kinase [Phytohabitans houttuyneae]